MLGVTWRGRQSAHPQILIVFLSAISGAALAGARQRRLILDYGGGWWRVVEGGWGVSTAGHYRHIWSPHWATPSQQNMQTGGQSAELPPICFVRLLELQSKVHTKVRNQSRIRLSALQTLRNPYRLSGKFLFLLTFNC